MAFVLASPRLNPHGKIEAVDEADVVVVKSADTVQSEIHKSNRRSGDASTAAFYGGGGAAVTGYAWELAGIVGTEGPDQSDGIYKVLDCPDSRAKPVLLMETCEEVLWAVKMPGQTV